jgi:glycosyltransferase involved in cell wall biosynthesis
VTDDAARHVRFVVPEGIDDPARVSGGNVYDLRVRDGLRELGWRVTMSAAADAEGAASLLRAAPDGALVLIDGLVACQASATMAAETPRLRILVLTHMLVAAFPDASADDVAAERRALATARRVIATSRWTADELVRRGIVTRERVAVAPPGVEATDDVARPESDGRLLCVGVVAPHKGQDTLVQALSQIPDDAWTCEIVGSTDRYPAFAAMVARDAQAFGGRVTLAGVLGGTELAAAYRRTALFVAPSRVESAGMAIADARARGIPVVAARTGGIPDALADGGGVLVPPGDSAALAAALHDWMTDPALRERLRREAAAARSRLPRWSATVAAIAEALESA